MNCPRVIEKNEWPQTLQTGTHYTITSGAPCWKSTINSSQSLKQLMWGELPREHINKAVANFTKLPIWLRLPTVVTPSICSNSVHLQVCILILSPTNWLFSQPPTDYWWRQCSECWENEKLGYCLGWNSIILSLSHIFQQNSCVKIHAKSLNALLKYQQKSKGGGLLFYVHHNAVFTFWERAGELMGFQCLYCVKCLDLECTCTMLCDP